MALGLPDTISACLFDLDGVLTQTATVHAKAWKQVFDGFLRERADRENTTFIPFDDVADYDRYVDGRSRADGVRAFLAARRIEVPEGRDSDTVEDGTVLGLARTKNDIVLRLLAAGGVHAYPGSVRYVRAARAAGMATAVVSAAGLDGDFDAVVDGVIARERKLAGKPAPDTYLAAADALKVPPTAAAVFEDALAGVQAGRAGQFGWVVGVDRVGQADDLRQAGADTVVTDLAQLMG
jgi:HAD superfamily hydrolase (TIGR01509 family)